MIKFSENHVTASTSGPPVTTQEKELLNKRKYSDHFIHS